MEEKLKQISDRNTNCIKVVLYGPESTGKTSLAKALADYYETTYVEEFSRYYAELKSKQNLPLTKDDVLPIAIGQIQKENEQLKSANKLLICDTDLLETQVYSEFYYNGFCPEIVKKKALENTYDLYFLTYIDIAWEADGIRDKPNNRLQMYKRFEQILKRSKKPFITVKGSFEERLNTCKRYIDELLKKAY
ncbi:nicotinamide-nucleotide adenylyltransferase, NadR type [Formosa sp. Hel1_31_208]|uniref:AAA family ATPase n=1 Tax=Formosa sp. Hel1_31_208 TaxID=1798225 RepID=UPI00087D6798|nr:ATP-binding protein [Formosa sp. Hel1_31_208]SDR82343.1 nicotinamide-nucleotide adenylyltransferase, NadR type [Formosa sp. Hel1_31_208]